MNRLLKKTLKILGIILGILLIIYFIAFAYISANKQSIIKQVTEDVSKKLNGKVTIGDVDLSFFRTFPQASVRLSNVTITDSMYARHHHVFFNAKQVFAELSIVKLIKKESAVNGVRVNHGAVYLFTDTSGYTNTYLFNPKTTGAASTESSSEKNQLKSIRLLDVQLIIDDRKKEKLQDIAVTDLSLKLDDRDSSSFIFSTQAKMLVHTLAFNLAAGSFVKEKKFEGNFDLKYDKKTNQLKFDSIDIKLGGHPFNLTGSFDLKGPDPQFRLNVHTRQISYPFTKSLLTEKIAKAFAIANVDKNIDADAFLNGPLNGGDPLINVYWVIKNAHLQTPFFDFDKASLQGFYTDEVTPGLPRRDPNSKIIIRNFSAEWQGLPVTSSNIEIVNLFQPTLACDLHSAFPLTKLNNIIKTNSIQLRSGEGAINLTYKGPLQRNNNTNSFLNGAIDFKNGTIFYDPRNVSLTEVNGRLAFRSSDIFVENLQCVVLKNKIVMNGSAKNLLSLVNTEPDKVNIDWNIYSPSLDLGAFTYLLKSRKKSTYKKPGAGSLGNIAQKIDDVLERGRLNVSLKADRMTYKKLQASDVHANVSLLQDRYLLNDVSMEQAGGRVTLNGALISQSDNYNKANITATLNNVDVSRVFVDFNNFGQDGITSKNLSGKLTAKVTAALSLDNDGKAYPNSIVSVVDFSLKNGALTNFEPVKKLQNILFKNRDFENIHFAELKDKLEIANQEVKINRMEIQSTVLSLFVEGIYSMKGNTDMSIQVPLRNLRKRKEGEKLKNEGVDQKVGASIYLRGRPGSDGNIQFKPDLFKKFRKDDSKE
ncbi:MAG: AsmA-like C-terminal region-containing protein [Ginsengibacter sp.]